MGENPPDETAPALVDLWTDDRGQLEEWSDGDEVQLTYVPDKVSGIHTPSYAAMRFNISGGPLRIFPKKVSLGSYVDQFSQVKEIRLDPSSWDPQRHSDEHERFRLQSALHFPSGFKTIYAWGLGIAKDYQRFIYTIEENTPCRVIWFTRGPEGLDEAQGILRVSIARFERFRSLVNLNRGRGQTAVSRVLESGVNNVLADLLGLEKVEPKYARNPVINALTEEVATGYVTTAADREALADAVSRAAPKLAEENPRRLVQLREDIEMVTLDTVIAEFEDGMHGAPSNNEDHWQKFFERNQFALQLIFSTPTVVDLPHATVRSTDRYGQGGRITDFLCVNPVTRAVLLVEIKKPSTQLMEKNPYRGHGKSAVYGASIELSGSIAQVQSQMSSAAEEAATRFKPSLDTINELRGAVIIGKVSELNEEQLESFLRYRKGLADLVLTYDEVLERLKGLRDFLRPPGTADPSAESSG